MRKKTLASISLDLDNQWSYMKTHGDKEWEEYPSYLNIIVPYTLNIMDELNVKITFFIVGKDASVDINKEFIKQISDRGHEIGNHSFHHEVWLSSYTKEEMDKEIEMAEKEIIAITGRKPVGFRGPGYVWSPVLFQTLIERGYHYDGSTLPTFIGPLARIYYFLTSKFTPEERKKRKHLFGKFSEGFRPTKPYYWNINGNQLLEIPVTTMPVFKIPFHLSYLLYLSRFSKRFMIFYLNIAILLCKITKTEPSFLLHPLDLISGDRVPQLAFFPGMDIKSEKKAALFKFVINKLQKHFEIVTMEKHSNQYKSKKIRKRITLPIN